MPARNQHNTAVTIPEHALNLGNAPIEFQVRQGAEYAGNSTRAGNAPIEFQVRQGEKVLGTLKVANARVEWWKPRGKKPARKVPWSQFIELMEGS